MSERSAIAWTDHTWNPWQGCTQVSPGCAHCYMFREKRRFGQDPSIVVRSKHGTFRAPLGWKEPARVFTCSWSDFFHEAADPWRPEAWAIIRATPHLTYQILTKRIERIREVLPPDWEDGYPNVWLGVSIESRRWLGRAYQLAKIPAVVRFISAEPLLGAIDFTDLFRVDGAGQPSPIHWVIAGGESGPRPRVMLLDWARQIRDDCQAHDVAFFLKQLGGHPNKRADELAVLDGVRHVAWPIESRVPA